MPAREISYEILVIMTIKDFFSFRQNKYFWLNILAMIVAVTGIIWGVLTALDIYTRHGEAVIVPDVKGMGVAEAEKIFRNRGLSCIVSDSSYVKKQPAGCILDYNPSAGQKVKEGRIIYLTINTLSIPLCQVPDVADNSSMRQAEARLLAAGFKIAEIEKCAGEQDWVYGVKYQDRLLEIDEKVPVGSTLVLVVGNGEQEPEEEADSTLVETDINPQARPADSEDNEDSWF